MAKNYEREGIRYGVISLMIVVRIKKSNPNDCINQKQKGKSRIWQNQNKRKNKSEIRTAKFAYFQEIEKHKFRGSGN